MTEATDNDAAGRPLRVVAITPTALLSGAERVLIRHAVSGIAAGDSWVVLSPTGRVSSALAIERIEHEAIPELKLGEGPRPIAAIRLAIRNVLAVPAVRRATRSADVIIANSVLCLPVLWLARTRAPVVWLVHDVITRKDLSLIARRMARVVTRSVPVSEAAGKLSRQLGIPTTVVFNGVTTAPHVTAGERELETPPVVGLNAVLTEWKGQHVMLEAAARLTRPATVELMGGTLPKDGDYEHRLRRRAERPDLVGRVRFLGHQDNPDEVANRWSIAVSASVEHRERARSRCSRPCRWESRSSSATTVLHPSWSASAV